MTPQELMQLPQFLARTQPCGTCLLWRGAFTHGVPCLSIKGRRIRVRNTLMPAFVLNETVVICVCEKDDACVQPSHLRVTTMSEAYRIKGWARSSDPSRGPGSYQRKKTHCPAGHAYIEGNIYRPPGRPTERRCRACMKKEGSDATD